LYFGNLADILFPKGEKTAKAESVLEDFAAVFFLLSGTNGLI